MVVTPLSRQDPALHPPAPQLLSRPQHRLSRESLSQDPLTAVAPLLSEPHLSALDRRLSAVLQTVRRCRERHRGDRGDHVLYDDVAGYAVGDVTAAGS